MKGHRCFECGKKAHHAHHIIPRSVGGSRTIPLCEKHHGMVHENGGGFTRHRELVVRGIQRAKMRGVKLGRPPEKWDYEAIRALRNEGLSIRAIARELKISNSSAYRGVKKLLLNQIPEVKS